nr:MAG TPA: hypothetical protein [Caudoviricetes sp.]
MFSYISFNFFHFSTSKSQNKKPAPLGINPNNTS